MSAMTAQDFFDLVRGLRPFFVLTVVIAVLLVVLMAVGWV
jgi:hypothetical protein